MIESKLSLMEKENLYEIIHNLPLNFGKSWEGYKDMLQKNAWEKIANSLAFIRDGTYYSIF